VATASKTFDAKIEKDDEPGNLAYLRVPPDIIAAFGPRKRPPVVVTLNGYTYRTTVSVYGGEFYIGVRAEVREAAKVRVGQIARVKLAPDVEPRTIEVPADLDTALGKARLREAFAGFAYTHRKEFVVWITGAKRPATRAARIEKTVAATRRKRSPT
jgi:hypothetical protein